MGYYFDDSQSINAYEGTDPQAIISSLAYRYMGQKSKARTSIIVHTQTTVSFVQPITDTLLISTRFSLTARTRNVYGHSQSSIQPVNLHSVGI